MGNIYKTVWGWDEHPPPPPSVLMLSYKAPQHSPLLIYCSYRWGLRRQAAQHQHILYIWGGGGVTPLPTSSNCFLCKKKSFLLLFFFLKVLLSFPFLCRKVELTPALDPFPHPPLNLTVTTSSISTLSSLHNTYLPSVHYPYLFTTSIIVRCSP